MGAVVALPNGAVVAANSSFCLLLGRSEAELRSMTYAELAHPDDRVSWESERAQVVSGSRRRARIQVRYRRADASYVLVREDLTRIADVTGRLLYVLSHLEDLSEGRPAMSPAGRQQELLDLAQAEITCQAGFLDTVLENLTDGVAACDALGRLALMNRSRREALGLVEALQEPPNWRGGMLLFEADGITPTTGARRRSTGRSSGRRSAPRRSLKVGRRKVSASWWCTRGRCLTSRAPAWGRWRPTTT